MADVTLACPTCGKQHQTMRSLRAHQAQKASCRLTPQDYFWDKVEKTDSCWLWRGHVNRNGYGRFSIRGESPTPAHRFAYATTTGSPIPDGMTIDHLCRVRHCVNPDHLEAVTMRTNVLRAPTAPTAINARKTHCIRGHELTGQNLMLTRTGKRNCRTCKRAKDLARYHRMKGSAA